MAKLRRSKRRYKKSSNLSAKIIKFFTIKSCKKSRKSRKSRKQAGG